MKENKKEIESAKMSNNKNNQNEKVEVLNNNIPTPEKLPTVEDDKNENESNYESEAKFENKIENKKKAGGKKRGKMFSIGLAMIPLLVLAGMIYFLTSPFGQNLITSGTPLPEVTIEKIEFHENQIVAFIRNTGPQEVTISQADVNDRIHSAAIEPSQVIPRLGEAKVIIPFLWNTAEPYEVGITTSDGTRFSDTVQAAAPAPIPNSNQIIIFAILGIFVGVVPVLIGLAWYPFMRKITKNQYNFFLSLTAGLLVFLGIDAVLESNEIAADNLAKVFNGQILVPVIVISTFLGLYFMSDHFVKRAEYKTSQMSMNISGSEKIKGSTLGKSKPFSDPTTTNLDKSTSDRHNTKISNIENISSNAQTIQQIKNKDIIKPLAISLMVAIGIGFHNFGEGLAIGAAVLLGEIALSTFLIIGFTIHNTTEGLAIVAPLAKTGRLMIKRLVIMGLIAGVPTIVGTWIGGFVYSPLASVIFLSIGAGAIFQVVYSLVMWMSKSFRRNESEQTVTVTVTDNKLSNTKETVKSSTPLLQPKEPNSGISIVIGFIVGMLIMYLTGLFV